MKPFNISYRKGLTCHSDRMNPLEHRQVLQVYVVSNCGITKILQAYIHSLMNVHMWAKFGANRPSRLVDFPEFVLRLVRLFAAVRADSRKNTPKTTFKHRKLSFRPEYADINVTYFLHSNFRSVQWCGRGGVNDILTACKN